MVAKVNHFRTIRDLNKFKVLSAIRKGAVSRSDVADATGLSYPTVRSLVQILIREGLVKEGVLGESRGGRRPGLLEFLPTSRVVVGVDLDGPRIKAGIADLDGNILSEMHDGPPVPSGHDVAESVITVVNHLVSKTSGVRQEQLLGVGISVRQLLDSSVTAYHDVTQLLKRYFEVPVLFDHNYNMALVAESRFGAAVHTKDVIFVNIGEGISAGLMLKGKIHRGSSGNAGEFGHTTVDITGPFCDRCGRRRGCLELYASASRIIERAHQKLASESGPSLLVEEDGELTLQGIVNAASMGDTLAHNVIRETAEYVSAGVIDLVNIFNPHMVVIGGNPVAKSPYFVNHVRTTVQGQAWPASTESLEVTPSLLGENAKVLGAVSQVLEKTFSASSIAEEELKSLGKLSFASPS